MDRYGSHLYLLKDAINALKPKKVLETGMGFDSTKLFIDNGIDTTSIEMQSSEWYYKVYREYEGNPLFKSHLFLGTDGAIKHIDSSEQFDFIFVDGHGDNRWEQINASFNHTNVIITHDTEALVYEWQNTKLPERWVWVDFTEVVPWTSILTNNIDIISGLLHHRHEIYHDISNKDYTDLRRLSK